MALSQTRRPVMIKDIVLHLSADAEHDVAANYAVSVAEVFGAHLAAVIFGFFFALAFYRRADADPLPAKLGWLSRAMRNRSSSSWAKGVFVSSSRSHRSRSCVST